MSAGHHQLVVGISPVRPVTQALFRIPHERLWPNLISRGSAGPVNVVLLSCLRRWRTDRLRDPELDVACAAPGLRDTAVVLGESLFWIISVHEAKLVADRRGTVIERRLQPDFCLAEAALALLSRPQ
jgi:hypothetical protein